MNKKTILLFSFLMFICLPVHAFSATVSIPDTHTNIGETVEIPVMVDDAAGIAGFNFDITYDASVLQVSGVRTGSLTKGWMVNPNTTTAGLLKIAGVDMLLSGLSGGKGSLAMLQFKVIGKSKESASLGFGVSKLSNNMGASINSTTVGGKVKISNKKDK